MHDYFDNMKFKNTKITPCVKKQLNTIFCIVRKSSRIAHQICIIHVARLYYSTFVLFLEWVDQYESWLPFLGTPDWVYGAEPIRRPSDELMAQRQTTPEQTQFVWRCVSYSCFIFLVISYWSKSFWDPLQWIGRMNSRRLTSTIQTFALSLTLRGTMLAHFWYLRWLLLAFGEGSLLGYGLDCLW